VHVLASWLGDWDVRRVRGRSLAVLGVVLAAAILVIVSIDSLARQIREPYPVLLNEPPGYLARTIVKLALRKTTDAAPSIPKGLSAIRTRPGQVRLTWQDDAGETEYSMEMRSVGGGFRYVGSKGSNVTAYVVENLDADTSYAFRLRACRRERCSPTRPRSALSPADRKRSQTLNRTPP
jgi:hypothetical protein